jgi:putative transcriptional regulator
MSWIEKGYLMESILDIYRMHVIINGKLTLHQGGLIVNNRLEELRKLRNIKQEDLATALEVSRQTIGSLENGRYNPSILLAFKIAKFFDVKIEDIFIYEEDNHEEK